MGPPVYAKMSAGLYKLLGVEHGTTTAYTPQCNAQIERANQTITKYLASFVDEQTLDWEDYLAPLMFCYNTSFHRSIKQTPHCMLYGVEPNMPSLPAANVRRKFYGEAKEDEIHQTLLYARDVARRNNQDAQDDYKEDHDRKVKVHNFQLNQLVLLDEHSFLHKNQKLAPKWSGPHRITKIKSHANMELLLKNGKTLLVHAHRLKPYFVPSNQKVEFEEPNRMNKIPNVEIPTIVNENEREFPNSSNDDNIPGDNPPTGQFPHPLPTTKSPAHLHPFLEVQDEMFSDKELDEEDKPLAQLRRERKLQNKLAQQKQVQLSSKQKILMPSFALLQPTISKNPGGIDDRKTEIVQLIEPIEEREEEEWTVVKRKKEKKEKQWSTQQEQNFVDTGDIFKEKHNFNYQSHSGNEHANNHQVVPHPSLQTTGQTTPAEELFPEEEEDTEEDYPSYYLSEGEETTQDFKTGVGTPEKSSTLGEVETTPTGTPVHEKGSGGSPRPIRRSVSDPLSPTHASTPVHGTVPKTFIQFLTEQAFPFTRSRGPAPPPDPLPENKRRRRQPSP